MAQPRPFRISDGLILIGCTGVGMAASHGAWGIIKGWTPLILERLTSARSSNHSLIGVAFALAQPVRACLPFVAAWTLGVVLVGLSPPRPPLRKLSRQPGWMGCTLATIAIALECIMTFVSCAVSEKGLSSIDRIEWFLLHGTFLFAESQIGFAILAAWLAMAMAGRWQPAPNWIDRLGRVLCLIWIATLPLFHWTLRER